MKVDDDDYFILVRKKVRTLKIGLPYFSSTAPYPFCKAITARQEWKIKHNIVHAQFYDRAYKFFKSLCEI